MLDWFKWLFMQDSVQSHSSAEDDFAQGYGVNPANGMPMVNESIDIEGNPYGLDNDQDLELYQDTIFQDNFFGDNF